MSQVRDSWKFKPESSYEFTTRLAVLNEFLLNSETLWNFLFIETQVADKIDE